MILDLEAQNASLGPMSIDADIQCFSVVDNSDSTLKTFDLRKFKMISQFKLGEQGISSFLVSEESGIITLVCGSRVILCKILGDQIKTLLELAPKSAISGS